jgi:hypothetical protein
MTWQLIVIVVQISVGGAFVVSGVKIALHHIVAAHDKGHAERLSKALGRRVGHSAQPIVLALLLALVGGVMLATATRVADAIGPVRVEG